MAAEKVAAQTNDRDPEAYCGEYAQARRGAEFGTRWTTGLAIYLAFVCFLAIYALVSVWPYILPLELDQEDVHLLPGGLWTVSIGPETRYLLIAFFAGAIGSMIHAITSYLYWVGIGSTDRNWITWYFLRPFVGGSLALGVYFAMRGGFVAGNQDAAVISIYGVAAISFMAGLFSRQAMDKLGEVFDTLFRKAEKTAPSPKKRNGNVTNEEDDGEPDEAAGNGADHEVEEKTKIVKTKTSTRRAKEPTAAKQVRQAAKNGNGRSKHEKQPARITR